MLIEIEASSPVPIYTQLTNQIKKAIVKGELKRGEMLPSVRVLAGDLGVNMHTINKAYNLMVDEGILLKSQRGYLVTESKQRPEEVEEQLKEKIEELLIEVYLHEVSSEHIKEWMQDTASQLEKEW